MNKREIDFVCLLGKDSIVADGNIVIPLNLKISGFVKMNIESEEKVVVTESGTVEGNIVAETVQIHGKVSGLVKANRKVTIFKTGVVTGAIYADTLTIEEGAHCNIETAVGKEPRSGQADDFEKAYSGKGYNTRTTVRKFGLSHNLKQYAVLSDPEENGLMSSTNGRKGVHQNGQEELYAKSDSQKDSGENSGPNIKSGAGSGEYPDPSKKYDADSDPIGESVSNVKKPDITTSKITDNSSGNSKNSSKEIDQIDRFW